MKKKIIITLSFIFAVILFLYIGYFYQIRTISKITKDNIKYNELKNKLIYLFNTTNKSVIIKPFDNKNLDSQLKIEYKILNIEIDEIASKNKYPYRAKINYSLKKYKLKNSNKIKIYDKNKSDNYLYNLKTQQWFKSTLSNWIIPFIFVTILVTIIFFYNYYKEKKRKKKEKNDKN